MERSTLIIFTESYPWSLALEDSFLEPELKALKRVFQWIIIVPAQCHGTRVEPPIPVRVEEGWAKVLQAYSNSTIQDVISVLIEPLLWQELIRKPWILFHVRGLRALFGYILGAHNIARWTTRFLNKNAIDISNVVFFTYWFWSTTTGLTLLKKNDPDMKILSRAHGFDIYPQRHVPAYIPCREKTLAAIDRVFFTSDHGRRTMEKLFPKYTDKFATFPLGTPDPGFRAHASHDGIIRIASCSGMVPVKQLELMAAGIAAFASQFPQSVEWHHLGDGPVRKAVELTCQEQFPHNARWFFPGRMNNAAVFAYYRNHPIDVFLNTSESEGGRPVAIMEAMSCGIPAIGPAVGGVSEIVNDIVGKLLPAHPSPDDIAAAIQIVVDAPEQEHRRNAARKQWEKHYTSSQNAERFAKYIIVDIQEDRAKQLLA